MTRPKFKPSDWLPKEDTPKPAPEPLQTEEQADDIELLTRRIEESGTDITATYDSWRDIGFALCHHLGEAGRSYYHRISRFYPGYTKEETDLQYDRCLHAHGTASITIKTLFQKAKDAGISISFPRRRSRPNPQKPATEGSEGNEGLRVSPLPEPAAAPMPTFSPKLRGQLPDLLESIIVHSVSDADADLLILGAIVTLSAVIPTIYGVYGNRRVWANLFLFVTAQASAGKGRLSLCRRLVQPIHQDLRDQYISEMAAYTSDKIEYDIKKKKDPHYPPPEEPGMKMLIIPANSSATSVYQVLGDNDGCGLLFETEGDTLATVFKTDYGDYSDGFRKAFHHEPISYNRRKDREYVELLHPRLSAVLSGTPRQISALIPDAENGLFSRFIFYYIDFEPVWIDVFARSESGTLDAVFDALGEDYLHFHETLLSKSPTEFLLTPDQQHRFNAWYASAQTQYSGLFGPDIIPSVRRLGLITFRIAMILSTLRLMDTGEYPDRLLCAEQDYNSSMAIAAVLIHHSLRVWRELSSEDIKKPAAERSDRQYLLYKRLPESFHTAEAIRLAADIGIPDATAERYLKTWASTGAIHRDRHGHYTKPSNP